MSTLLLIKNIRLRVTKVALLLAVLLTFIPAACENKDTDEMPLTETAAPSFTLISSDAMNISLSGFSNKVVVLFFFGSNCPSCKAVAPSIESQLAKPFAGRSDYQILGLDQWNGTLSAVKSFESITGVSFPLLLNAASVTAEYKTTYDRLVVIDKSGKIVFSGTQNASADLDAVKLILKDLLPVPAGDGSSEIPVTKGNAPDFALSSLSTGTVALSDQINKVVVLFFMGYNCPSCQAAAFDLETKLNKPYSKRTDFKFYGLDIWNGSREAVEAFRDLTGVTFPLLLDASKSGTDYSTTYDRLVVIDKKGNIAFSGKLPATSDIASVKSKLDELFAK
jgi:peroxiredoxin